MYFLGGLMGAFAEMGTIICLANAFQRNQAMIMASVATVSGLACMAGPPIGGALYDLGKDTSVGAFQMPFLVVASIPAVLTLCFACASSDNFKELEESREEAAPISSVISPSFILTAAGTSLSGGVVAALDPTLALRLTSDGLRYSAATVGAVFSMSSVSFTILSMPIGWCCDKYEGDCRVFKAIMGFGFFCLAATFLMIGPFNLDGEWTTLNSTPFILIGMVIKGVGSAAAGSPTYPDLAAMVPK